MEDYGAFPIKTLCTAVFSLKAGVSVIKNEQFQKALNHTRAHFVEDEFKLDNVIYVSEWFSKNADDSVSDNIMICFFM